MRKCLIYLFMAFMGNELTLIPTGVNEEIWTVLG